MRYPIPLYLASLVAICAAVSCQPAHAGADKWTGPDKAQHLVAGFVIGGGTTLMFESRKAGAAMGCLVGAAKEASDHRHPGTHTASVKDFLATCGGSLLGAYTGHVLLLKTNSGYALWFSKDF